MLSEPQIAELRGLLEAQRDRILASAQEAESFSRDRDITRIGRDSIDESAAEALFGTKLRLADRESSLLNKINVSLQRLEAGQHGLCEDCDEPISFARLQARPMTTLCIPCQEDREQGEA
jgi:DnaK suppressor protein